MLNIIENVTNRVELFSVTILPKLENKCVTKW